eukprot:1660736-Rhodomonas_salina.1
MSPRVELPKRGRKSVDANPMITSSSGYPSTWSRVEGFKTAQHRMPVLTVSDKQKHAMPVQVSTTGEQQQRVPQNPASGSGTRDSGLGTRD